MNTNLTSWIKFLASPNTFHNLCITYPRKVPVSQYHELNQHLTHEIEQALIPFSLENKNNFIHSDVLIFNQHEDLISTKDVESLEVFAQTRANFLPCKFVIFWGPQKISTIVSNKILKLLEDPPIPLSFILLGFESSSFLATIRSRFLNWRLPEAEIDAKYFKSTQELSTEALNKLKQIKTADELEQWADHFKLSEAECLEYLWQLVLPNFTTSQDIERHLAFQQWFDQSEQWKNSATERWYFLFQLMKNQLQSSTGRI